MNNSEKIRFRREMHRRIREVVAERRMARRGSDEPGGDPGTAGEQRIAQDDDSLVGG